MYTLRPPLSHEQAQNFSYMMFTVYCYTSGFHTEGRGLEHV